MKLDILELRPTQFSVGMREVQRKAKHLAAMSEKELEHFLEGRDVPAVVGPQKRVFLIDHHHLARACWEIQIKKLPVKIEEDLSKLDDKGFWDFMRKSKWTHLLDQLGGGPHDPLHLPENVRGLADDPYRSLSWAVRRDGGYEKTDAPFAEFKWAEFFRSKLKIEPGDEGFKKALKEALTLCQDHECYKLPGFIGNEGSRDTT
jgi:hypothetical protein